jgi:hypothetical protein
MVMKPFVSVCCEGEPCSFKGCEEPAEHKVEEVIFHDDPFQQRHPLTAYVCHNHFLAIMGVAANIFPGRS